jgi:hypothetical protein
MRRRSRRRTTRSASNAMNGAALAAPSLQLDSQLGEADRWQLFCFVMTPYRRVQPEAIEQVCLAQESFTDAQARRIAHELRDPSFTSTQSSSGDIPSSAPAIESSRANIPRSAPNERHQTSARARSPHEQRRSKSALSILVQHGDRAARLLTDGPANKGTRFASVRFFETGQTEEVPVSELRIEEIAPC